MAQYIDLDAVLAEIKRYKHKADERLKIKGRTLVEDCKDSALQNLCGNLLHFINTLEVKEVDLQSEIDRVWDNTSDNFLEDGWKEFEDIAKHFFELGVNASNPLTWEDIKLIWNITDEMDNMPEEEFYKEVLKRFKAQKGE